MSTTPIEPAANGRERRHGVRIPIIETELVPILLDSGNGGILLDLSATGFAVQAVGPLQSGATADFELQLPDGGKKLRGRGDIRWSEKSGRSGVRFVDFSEGSAADINAWIERLSPGSALSPPVFAPPAASLHMLDSGRLQRELAASNLDDDGSLRLIAERTQEATRATGVAVAIGPVDAMVCRASLGDAPAIGATLQANRGLSGECVRNKVPVRCDDTEDDPRVNAETCRQLGIRSAMLVPVLAGGKLCGVLEIFSDQPHAFRSLDIERLREIAATIATVASGRPSQAQTPTAVKIAATPSPSPPVVATSAIPPQVAPTDIATSRPRPANPEEEMLSLLRSGFVPPPVENRYLARIIRTGVTAVVGALLVIGGWEVYQNSLFPFDIEPAAETPDTPAPAAATNVQPAPKKRSARKSLKTKPNTAGSATLETRKPVPSATPATLGPGLTILSDPSVARHVTANPTNAPAQSAITAPALVYRVPPTYPPAARVANVGGEVVLKATVRADGSVGRIDVVSGDAILAQAAVDAVSHWRYAPSKRDGVAIEAPVVIRLTFDPHL